MCQREYLISRRFKLLLVLLKRACFPVSLSLTSVSWCQEYRSEPTCFTFYLRCRDAKGPVHC